MSYAICRVQKIKGASSVHGVQVHQRREKESNSNPDIDYSRSLQNYSIIPENIKSFNVLADERIKQDYTGQKAIRKDAVKVVSALFTSDNEFFQNKKPCEQRNFFVDCYNWACKKFGKDNIFSAVVHNDEQTPHLHIEFVPLTADGRLSAKTILGGRHEMQRMQDDFWKTVGKPWGLERGERANLDNLDAQKPRKHLETVALKQQTAAEIKQLEHKRVRLFDEVESMKLEHDKVSAELKEVTYEHASMHNYLDATKKFCDKLKDEKSEIENEILYYQKLHTDVTKVDDGAKKLPLGKMMVDTETYETVKTQAKAYRVNRNEITNIRKAKEENERAKEYIEQAKADLAKQSKETERLNAQAQQTYGLQRNLNHVLERTRDELEAEKERNVILSKNKAYLEGVIAQKDKNTAMLAERSKTAYIAITDIVQAVGMLKYDKTNGYKVENLTPQQARLIDAVANFAFKQASKVGYTDLAKRIDETVAINNTVKREIDALKPLERSHGLNR
jgi:seryl-tRNA synthetase